MNTDYVSTQHMNDMLAIKDGEIRSLKQTITDKDIEILKLKLELNLIQSNQIAKRV